MFGNSDSTQAVDEICSMFDTCNNVKSQDFSVFHQIVLGLRQSSLREELRVSPHNLINKVDKTGNTPLTWAARRGDFQKWSSFSGMVRIPELLIKTDDHRYIIQFW